MVEKIDTKPIVTEDGRKGLMLYLDGSPTPEWTILPFEDGRVGLYRRGPAGDETSWQKVGSFADMGDLLKVAGLEHLDPSTLH